MALDAAMLRNAVARRSMVPVLRIYRWAAPALSLGAHQVVDDRLERRCRQAGVELVRRPTGGSAVYHGEDLTYAVVAPYAGMSVLEAYRWVAGGLIAGLRSLGVEARVVRHRAPGAGSHGLSGWAGSSRACFAEAVGADLQAAGLKICGSAQKRSRGWFLQHGSIPLEDGSAQLARLLDPGETETVHATWLGAFRPGISYAEARRGLISGFRAEWGPYDRCEAEDVLARN